MRIGIEAEGDVQIAREELLHRGEGAWRRRQGRQGRGLATPPADKMLRRPDVEK